MGLLEEQDVDGAAIATPTDLLGTGRAALGEEADYLEVIRLIEDQAGVEVRG